MIGIGGGELIILFLGLLFLLAVGGLVGAAIWLASRGSGASNAGRKSVQKEDALDILRRRYARGEITQEEFQQMHQDLIM